MCMYEVKVASYVIRVIDVRLYDCVTCLQTSREANFTVSTIYLRVGCCLGSRDCMENIEIYEEIQICTAVVTLFLVVQ